MTRHSKNCTANTVYTYHERKKDARHSGYGTQTVRLGKDSIRAFDCCCLTLQPAQDPVITTDGYLYDRAAILEYILSQKSDIKRREKIYAKQCDRAAREVLEMKRAANDQARAFMALNTLDTHSKASAQAAESAALARVTKGSAFTSVESDYKPGNAVSFWTVDPTSVKSTKHENHADIPKPDPVIRCPMSGKPLKYKDLIAVNFTNLDGDGNKAVKAGESSSVNEVRRVCAVSKDLLTSATKCYVLRTSGSVVTKEVVDKIIRKEMIDPISSDKLTEKDLIEVQVGCGGFADGRSILTASKAGPVMPS